MFVAIGIAFVGGLILGGLIPLVFVMVWHTGPFSPEELRDALTASILKPVVLLSSGAVTQMILVLTGVSAAVLSPVPFRRRLRLNPSTLPPLGYIVAPIGALAVSLLFTSVVGLLRVPESGTLKLLGDVFRHLTPAQLIFAVLIIGIVPGFAEELLFRGYAQTRLVRRLGRWNGIWITAALFGLMHMDKMQSPFAAAFGLYLGYVAEKSGSIRPTILCHAVNNSLEVVIGRYANSGTGEGDASVLLALALLAVVILGLCVTYLKFRVHPPATANLPGFDPAPLSEAAIPPTAPA